MSTAQEDIAFVARSNNRVSVFSALGAEPLSRDELMERTGVERVTLGRILADFEDRGWVEKDGREYALSLVGQMIAGAFEHLVETTEAARKLDGVIQWLPTGEMPFDLRRLGTADITLPRGPDPSAPSRRAGQRLREGDEVRLLLSVIVAEVLDACRDATIEGDQTVEAVFTADVVDTIADDPDMSAKVAEMLESDRVAIYRSEESFPFVMGLLDDRVALGVTDEENLPRAYLELQDETVRRWVEETYEGYRRDAERVSLEDIEG